MSNAKKIRDGKCPRCGCQLTGEVAGGLCPNCLVHVSFDTSDEETLAGPATKAEREDPQAKVLISPNIRYFGDYELQAEIARGGMGVVFKARQKSLNRLVAIKMIRGGPTASPMEVKRFRVEAEAAANLQHPNIVAIHEVGEHEGQDYFSMDLVEGTNLAELVRAQPLAEREAAQLLKTVAEAVHYAHQRGVLHRDLKPQNILVDTQGRPRITDFGLAKLLKEDSSLTVTGDVMGSPGYMPPEQAAGRVAQISPASDVYALGAVLYFLLTGNAPFAGTSPMETLRLAADTDPLPPRQVRPNLSPDLETICLKCLEKSPERRYATARSLAEELERYLQREPILARPAGRVRRAWKWAARHPWLVTGGLSLLLLGLVGFAFGLCEQVDFLEWQRAHAGGKSPYRIDDFFPQWLLSFMVIEFLFLQMLPLALYLRARMGTSLGQTGLRWFMALGVAQIGLGLLLLMRGIAANVWAREAYAELFLLVPVPALTNVWFGGVLLWQAWREMRQAAQGSALPLGAARLLRVKDRRAFAVISALMFVLSLVMSGWVYRETGALVLPYVVSVFAVALVILFTGAFRRSRGIEASVYVPPLICSFILSFQLAGQPSGIISVGAFFIGLIGGLSLLDVAKLEGEALPPKGGWFRRLRQWDRLAWRRLAKTAGIVVCVFVTALLVENVRGRWQLSRWRTVMERRGEVFELEILLPPKSAAAAGFETAFRQAYKKLREYRVSSGMESGMEETAKPGFARRGSQAAQVPGWEGGTNSSWEALGLRLNAVSNELDVLPQLLRKPPASRGLSAADWLGTSRYFPSARASITCAQELNASALFQLHQGNLEGALEGMCAIAGLAKLYRDDPALISQMMRLGIVGLGSAILWDAAQAEGWNDAQLQQLQHAWADIEVLPQLVRAFEGERVIRRHRIRTLAGMTYGQWGKDNLHKLQDFGANKPAEYSFLPYYCWRAYIYHPLWRVAWARQEELHYLKTMQLDLEFMRTAALQPSAVVLKERLGARRSHYRAPWASWRFYNSLPIIDRMSEIIGSPSKIPAPTAAPVPVPPPPSNPPLGTNVVTPIPIQPSVPALKATYHLPLVGSWGKRDESAGVKGDEFPLPMFDGCWTSSFRNLTLRNMAVTALALKRYELRHGRPAPNLAALVPEFLDKLPMDLMDGQTLRYHFTVDGHWILYSVGADGRDDGGDARPEGDNSSSIYYGRDLVWPRLEPTKPQ